MISTSWDYKHRIAENTKCAVKANLYLKSPSGSYVLHELSGTDIMAGSISFSHATSTSASFDIGAAVTGSFKCTLDNNDQRFDDFDFTNSKIVPFLGVELPDGTVEWINKGTYYLEQPSSYGSTIGLSGLDSMCLFDDRKLSEVSVTYPTTAEALVRAICAKCGVTLLTSTFANSSYKFPVKPKDDMSCHEAICYIAQATGNFARMTNDNRLQMAWYDTKAFETEDWLDGETFDNANPYASGDTADGGNFTSYNSGAVVNGGNFAADRIVNVIAYAGANIVTDDVIITGVSVTASDEITKDSTAGRKGEKHLQGQKGYVLEISGNPFVAYGQAQAVAKNIYNQCGGMVFRPFDVQGLGDPSIEAGDPIIVTDYRQRVYKSYITSVNYKLGSYCTLACHAETPLRRASAAGSAITRTLQAARDEIRAEKTEREVAIEQLNQDLENSSGMFATPVKEADGSTTYYIHDKKEKPDQKPGSFTQSKFVWKINAGGFGMSVDGGKTYQFGLDKYGNAILNRIYAIGLNASYITTGSLNASLIKTGTLNADLINTGSLRVKDKSGNTIFCADVKNNNFWWESKYSKLTQTGALTVTSGKIGGFTIGTSSLKSNDGSLTLNADGTGKIGGFTIGTNYLKNGGLSFLNTGIHFVYKEKSLGFVAANEFTNYPTKRGMEFELIPDGDFIAWSCRRSAGEKLYVKMIYTPRAFANYSADTISLGCALDARYHKIVNASIYDTNIYNSSLGAGVKRYSAFNGTFSFTYASGFKIGTTQLQRYKCEIKVDGGFIMSIKNDPIN